MSAPRTWEAVLRPPSSPGLWPAGSSNLCARCGQATAGLTPGDLCAACVRDVTRRASRLGRLVAIVTTLMVVGYLMLTLRSVPPASQATARTVGAVAARLGEPLCLRRPGPGGGGAPRGRRVRGRRPPQFRLPDGRLVLSQPGEPLLPSELVRTAPEAAIALDATQARPRTELAYVVDGAARWQATYQVVLQGARCQVSGAATVTSQTLRADTAEVQVVAGSINRVRPEAPAPRAYRAGAVALAEVVVTGAAEQAVGETHVYQLPGKVTLEPGVPVSVALFPRGGAAYTQEFVVPGALPWRGFPGQAANDENKVPIQVWYTVKRGRGTSFGDRPLPGGTVQLYHADSSGRVQLLREASNGHTAPGQDLRVQSSDAFDITAERVQTDYAQEQLAPPKRGMAARQRITASYKVTISNAKPTAMTVDVREAR